MRVVYPRRENIDMAFGGYIRVSDVAGRAGASFISPLVQRETIERLANAHRLELAEIVEELDTSGHKPVDDRKLGTLIRSIEAGELEGLITWRLSRFSRNLLDGVQVAERITKAGGRLLAEDYDSSQPMGKVILGFLLGWAEEERESRRQGWKVAVHKAVGRGVHVARTPAGYIRNEDGTLSIDPEMVEAVRQTFLARARGSSLGECAALMHMSNSGVRAMLSNVVYLGHVKSGDVILEGAHPAIVDRRIWEQAQRVGQRTPRDGSSAALGLLVGLVKCANCGYACSVSMNDKSKSLASYYCRGRRAEKCQARASMAVKKLDDYVWPLLQERLGKVDLEAALHELFDAQVAWSAADEELQAFLEGARMADLGPELYASEVTRRREALQVASQQYRAALDAQDRLTSSDGLEYRREMARRLIERVVLHKATLGRYDSMEDRVEILWR